MKKLKVAVFGAGYWAQFQIPAWHAVGVEVVSIWNRTKSKAEQTADRFGIANVYNTPDEVFNGADFDIADIITEVDYHEPLVLLSASYNKPVICQKPMSTSLESCRRMADACREKSLWYAIHENFRFQPPIKKLKELLDQKIIGKIKHAHIQLRSPDRALMEKQPALKVMNNMALCDMGPHIFDVVRYYFGDIKNIYNRSFQSYDDIPVDDSAVSVIEMQDGLVVNCDLVHDFIYKAYMRGEKGTLTLLKNNDILIDIDNKATKVTAEWEKLSYIPEYDWELHGGHVFAAIPACLTMLRDCFLSGVPADTSGEDNLKTMEAVFAAIDSNVCQSKINLV